MVLSSKNCVPWEKKKNSQFSLQLKLCFPLRKPLYLVAAETLYVYYQFCPMKNFKRCVLQLRFIKSILMTASSRTCLSWFFGFLCFIEKFMTVENAMTFSSLVPLPWFMQSAGSFTHGCFCALCTNVNAVEMSHKVLLCKKVKLDHQLIPDTRINSNR